MTYIDQAMQFLQALTGMASPVVTFQTFYDPELRPEWVNEKGRKYDPTAEHWVGMLDQNNVAKLIAKQSQGCGAFFCINGSTTSGRYQKDIDILRAVVVDSDGAPFPSHWAAPPHALVVRDPTHWHAYWFLDGNCTSDEWRMAQMQLAIYFGGDERLTNTDRVMRLPGFNHQKDLSQPMPYTLHYIAQSQQRYALSTITHAFQLPAAGAARLIEWANLRKGEGGTGISLKEFDDSEPNRDKYIDYLLTRAEVAVEGSYGNQTTFKTAAAGRDYGLSPDVTIELMLEHWNDRCDPPWEEDELTTPVNNAYRYAQNATGSRSVNYWLEQPFTLPQGASTVPSTVVEYQIDLPPITKAAKIDPLLGDSIAMHGEGFNKNHTNNANVFLNAYSPNGEMFVYEEEVYRFNGKVFDKIDGKILNNMLFRAMAHTMPSNSDLNGSLGILRTQMAEGIKQMPSWRGQPDRRVDSVVVFNNGILDLDANTFGPHDINLLTSNAVTYDYDPSATCPNWEGLMEQLWGDEPDLIEAFQQWCGYCMVNDYRHQKIAVLVGKPRSGKGTIARVISEIIGKFNIASPGMAGLADSSVLELMDGKLLAIISDAADVQGPDRSKVMENLKRISGNDAMTFNRKYISAITTTMSARIMLVANEFPYFNDPSGAIVDRLICFPFRVSHAGREDPELTNRLLTELPGIANWAMMGLIKLRKAGKFTDPKATHFQKRMLRRSLSPSLSFFQEMLRHRTGGFLTDSQIYNRYVGWLASSGSYKMSRDQLMRGIESAIDGVERVERGKETGFTGLDFAISDEPPPLGDLP